MGCVQGTGQRKDKIAVELVVENVGGGDVTFQSESEFDRRYNKFQITNYDTAKWECRSSGRLDEGRFDNAGRATIICKIKEPMAADTLYTEDLSMTLEYKYKYLIQESVRVKKE